MDTPVVAGPPRAELVPVANFMPGVNLDEDAKYQGLIAPLPPEEIEFAKAMAMTKGNASRSTALIFPDMSEAAQRKWGSRHSKIPAVLALINYLQSLEVVDDRPVTADELKRSINARFRTVATGKDNSTFLEMAKLVREVNGIKFDAKDSGSEQLNMALTRADDVLASMRATPPVASQALQ